MITPLQCRLGRAALNWTVADLSKAAHVAPNTITKFEAGQGKTNHSTRAAIERALTDAGIILIHNGEGEGIKVRKPE